MGSPVGMKVILILALAAAKAAQSLKPFALIPR